MISPDEIKRIAREKEVDPTIIERDYVQNWFLKSLYTNTGDLIFKGGTSIRKAYIKDYRFSDVLDFTLSRSFEQEEMRVLIDKAKADVHEEIGIAFVEGTPFKEVKSGWKVKLHYTSKISGQKINLILDLTKHDLEIMVTPVQTRPITHNYPESCEVNLIAYSLLEITAEKLRALLQRGYPRDLYDVNNLWPLINKDKFKYIFLEKCKFKDVVPSLATYDGNEESIRSAWDETLRHQFKEIPDFDEAFQGVRKIIEELEIG